MSKWYDAFTPSELEQARDEAIKALYAYNDEYGLDKYEAIQYMINVVLAKYISSVARYNDSKHLFVPFNNHLKAMAQRNKK